ncbi:sperm acrosome membrane-associated protein 6 [Elgaria multicarinata webbii]|uniref:sperm acrosome membrane-associated protein 6 n=1 Tax=Elgaria multicarinata webbii TaxID=159646 RepID=UPI002FCD59AE
MGYPHLLWVAFSSQAAACLFCFSDAPQRLRVCQQFLGYESPQHGACLESLRKAFMPYSRVYVAVSEMEKLKDTFARIIFYLEEKGMANVPYNLAIPEAAQHVKKEVAQLQKAPACIPPCGFQREARWFRCTTCSIEDCQLPIDCPLQDVHKFEGDVTLLNCKVKFQIPPDCTFRWKFAKDMRTEELFLFQDLSFGFDSSLLIRPTLGTHQGTIACQIEEDNDVLVRKFFYLNVTEKRLGLEKKLQEMFKAILNPPPEVGLEEVVVNRLPSLQEMLSGPDALSKKSVIFLIVGIALSSMVLTLGAMTIYHWATYIKS